MKIKLLKLKSSILIAALGLLGFTACGDDDDIQPEYGVKAVYNNQANNQQTDNDINIIDENDSHENSIEE